MLENNIKWDQPLAKEYLDRGGSKAGAYTFLAETQDGKYAQNLPTGTHYLPPGGEVEEVLARLDPHTKKIVRACHPLDVTGMVDVLPTEMKDLKTPEQVRAAIQKVLEDSRSEEVASYVEYESGAPFDQEVGILIQDFLPHIESGVRRGSIVEHPHMRGVYRIFDTVSEFTCDADGRRYTNGLDGRVATSRNDRQVNGIIDLYRRVQESGLMPSSHSFQMEWVKKGPALWFLQSRLFKPFEKPGDFEVNWQSYGKMSDTCLTRDLSAFGVTGPEGTEPMHRADLTIGYNWDPEIAREFIALREGEKEVAYAHNGFDGGHSLPLDLQPRNMRVYLPYHPSSVLEHGSFRWLQKAGLTLGGLGAYNSNGGHSFGERCRHQEPDQEVFVKIISNGITGAMCFVE